MTARHDIFFRALIYNEGGYSDSQYDAGGKTIYGIAYNHHPMAFTEVYNLWKAERITMAHERAKQFYLTEYYNPLYDELPLPIAWKLFDAGVNMGIKTAVKLFQKTLNQFGGKKIKEDGVFGRKTLEKFREVFSMGNDKFAPYDPMRVLKAYIKMLWKRYRILKGFWKFGVGWKNRLLRILITNENIPTGFEVIYKHPIVGSDIVYLFGQLNEMD